MEMTYPIVIYIGAGVLAAGLIAVLFLMKGKKYTGGNKSANNTFVKQLSHYKMLVFEYFLLKVVAIVGIIGMIAATTLLIAKPIKVKTETNELHNRDIIIGFDVSTSLDSVSVEMCEQLEKFVGELKGERFGVVIFNGQAVRLVPLTDDYNYVISELEHIKKSIESYDNNYVFDLDELTMYRFAGTFSDNGSSLIGDGLASCLYSFPHIEDAERTRIIIMSTDNDQQERGRPLLELPEAADMCKKNGVVIFGLFPNKEVFTNSTTIGDYDTEKSQFKTAVEKTGGKFYEQSATLTVSDIVKDIQAQEAMEVDEIVIRKSIDQPKIPFIILFISLTVFFIMGVILVI